MKDRIRKLRRTLDMTQQSFADKLGVKRNTVGQWECGINALTDQVVFSICREFNVSEEWLRTGEGEMFRKLDREQEIAQMVAFLFREESTSFKYRFTKAICNMSEAGWDALETLVNEINKID